MGGIAGVIIPPGGVPLPPLVGRVPVPDGGGNTGFSRASGDSIAFSPESVRRAEEAARAQDVGGRGLGAQEELTEEEQRALQELKRRDIEVRRHEQAHLAAGGQYVRGGANFSYTTGPDGRRYATGGEVSIDVSAERTPKATIRKMQIVRRAALAPAQPSPQDRQVAAQASQKEAEARRALAQANVAAAAKGEATQANVAAEAEPPAIANRGGVQLATATGFATTPPSVDIRV